MKVIVILFVCILAAMATRALQTKYFPKTVPEPKDYAQHAKFVAMYSGVLVVASVVSYVLVPSGAPAIPTVGQLNAMMKERVTDAPVPEITRVI